MAAFGRFQPRLLSSSLLNSSCNIFNFRFFEFIRHQKIINFIVIYAMTLEAFTFEHPLVAAKILSFSRKHISPHTNLAIPEIRITQQNKSLAAFHVALRSHYEGLIPTVKLMLEGDCL